MNATPSKRASIDKRFALVDSDGKLRYPYRKTQRATGRHGFVVGSDRHGQGEYVDTLEEVIRAVVLQGKRVRVTVDPPTPSKGSSGMSLAAGREVKGYVIADELAGLVEGAATRPLGTPYDYRPRQLQTAGQAMGVYASISPHEIEQLKRQAGAGGLRRPQGLEAAVEWLRYRGTHQQLPVLLCVSEEADAALRPAEGAVVSWAANVVAVRDGMVKVNRLGELRRPLQATEVTDYEGLTAISHPEPVEVRRCLFDASVSRRVMRRRLFEPELEELVEGTEAAAAEVARDPKCSNVPETTRRALINARVGQGGYRLRMEALWGGRCAVTGCAERRALVASHAKAWVSSSNEERLDEYNGLLLAAHLDRLFDCGLISFLDDGRMVKSPDLQDRDLLALGIEAAAKLRCVFPRNLPYLADHRRQFGLEKKQ
jgi:hypothetical protein